jgi:hypothetical protein
MNHNNIIKQCQSGILWFLFFAIPTLFVVLMEYAFKVNFFLSHFEFVGASDFSKAVFCIFTFLMTASTCMLLLKKISQKSIAKENIADSENNKPPSLILLCISTLLLGLLFFISCLRYYKLFPIVLVNESNFLLGRSIQISEFNGDLKTLISFLKVTYNTGMGYFYYLAQPIIGNSMSSIKLIQISTWAIILVGFIFLFARTYKLRWYVIALMSPITVNAMMLVSVRRYKWHIMAFVASLGIYFFYYGLYGCATSNHKNNRARPFIILLGTLLFCMATVFYHMLVVYFAVIIGFYLIQLSLEKFSFKSIKIVIAIAIMLTTSFIILNRYSAGGVEYLKIHAGWALEYLTKNNGQQLFLNVFDGFREFFTKNMSLPFSALLIIGFTSAAYQFKNDWFSRFTISFFIIVIMMLLPTHAGLRVPDWNTFFLLPMTGLLMIGIKQIFELASVGSKNPAIIAAVLFPFSITVTILESNTYYLKKDYLYHDSTGIPDNPTADLALVILDMNHKLMIDPNVALRIPEKEAELANGGWLSKDAYYSTYLTPSLKDENYYHSLDQLANEIQQGSKHRKPPLIIYYAKGTPPASIEKFTKRISGSVNVSDVKALYPPNVIPDVSINYLYLYNATDKPNSLFLNPYPNLIKEEDTFFESLDKFNDIITYQNQTYGNF